mgnify:CR=1 FL=1
MMNLPVMGLAVIFQTRIREDFQMEAILVPHMNNATIGNDGFVDGEEPFT